jgi:hypothetical protein
MAAHRVCENRTIIVKCLSWPLPRVAAVVLFGLISGIGSPVFAQLTVSEAEARVADPFFSRTAFSISKTYYVAVNEPGASNSNDGRYPTYRGGVNGPFKDLTSTTLRQALSNANTGIRVYVRAGTYLAPDGGVRIRGGGTEATPAILAGYPGDPRPIIDGGECLPWATVRAIANGLPYTPRVESLIKLDGRYDIVQDLQLQCGFRYNVLTRGQHTIVRRNIIRGGYEDAIKNIEGDYGLVADNDISGFVSQGLDHFAADNWLVTRNVFHGPGRDPNTAGVVGNAITVKGSARNVVITRNIVNGFATAPDQAAITLGAPASLSLLQYDTSGKVLPAAIAAVAMANVVTDFTGAAFALQSCRSCVVADNDVNRTLGLVRIGISAESRLTFADSGVLPYSSDLEVRTNDARFASVDCSESIYLGQSCYALFVVNSEEAQDLKMDHNRYYTSSMPFFVYDWAVYDLPGLQLLAGIETGSQIVPLASWPN